MPHTATPRTLPVWRNAMSDPAAIPDRVAATLPSAADVIAGTTMPSPRPASDSPATSSPRLEPAPAMTAQPAAISAAPGIRPPPATPCPLHASRPAVALPAMIAAITGTNVKPVVSEENPWSRWRTRLTTKISP